MKPEVTAGRAWGVMLAGITLYDVLAPQGHTLSEGVDRALERNRPLTVLAIGYTAAHLLNIVPERVDIFKRGLDLIK